MNYNRREFIKTMGIVSGSLLLLPSCHSFHKEQYRVFTEKEAACLIALCEQLIPADEYPGATDAEVIRFIDKQLKLRFPAEQDIFKKGIASLQTWCGNKYNQSFEHLNASLQIEILQAMEKDDMKSSDEWTISPKSFFDKLLLRTMQGFYGSPRHGGNKDYASFRMMKLEYPLLIGQNRYNTQKS